MDRSWVMLMGEFGREYFGFRVEKGKRLGFFRYI